MSSRLSAFEPQALKLYEKYCFDCHSDGVDKGNFEFDKIMAESFQADKNQDTWHKIWSVIEEHQMPPANKKKQPTQAEREQMMVALEKKVFSIERVQKYAGPIDLIRMSNQQYANTIKELSGSWTKIENMLPLDSTSAGFNNISATQNLSALLFDRYNKIAEQVTRGMFTNHSNGDKGIKARGLQLLKATGDGKDLKKVNAALHAMAKITFRRELSESELKFIFTHYKTLRQSLSHKDALMKFTQSLFISPNFIFRTELLGTEKVEGNLARLDEFALASRLSYFLWNSAPDQHLLKLAQEGRLRKNLRRQVEKMIKSWKFKQTVQSFGEYWLGIQYLKNNLPSRKVIKNFDAYYLDLMKQETTNFLYYTFQENKPINELFSSQETFVDKRLAKLYGLNKPAINKMQKVTMPERYHRRGILNQPSVLIVTSDPDRTSPVKRGMWLLENILGMPPPPAPADVDILSLEKEDKNQKKLTFRQKLEKHRDNKACASCHAMMDPLGFAMDNFDAVGRWRTKDHGLPVDSKTNWRGNQINNFDDLYKLITTKYRKEFLVCFTKKLMTYALGRGLEIEDRISIMNIVKKVNKPDSRFHDIFYAIIESTPFQYRALNEETKAQ
jgi:hypothetical protein